MAGPRIEGGLKHERSRRHPHPNPPPQERERERGERLVTLCGLRERERSEPLFPSPACGGGWRARQRATGGGSRHKFRYRTDPQYGPIRNDNKIKEDTV